MLTRLILTDPLIHSAWRRFRHLWKPMASWTILVWFAFALLLTPLTSMVLGFGVFRGEVRVIGNAELVGWLTSPAGIFYLIIAGALSLVSTVIRFAGIFEIVTEDMNGRRSGLKNTSLRVARDIPWLFKICLITVAASVVLLIPLILGLGVIYSLFLGEHDINYYYVIRPSEWYYFLAAGGLWSVFWLISMLYVIGRSVLSLPAYLANDYTFFMAIKNSWLLARDRTVRLLRLIGFVIVTWMFIRLATDMLLIFTASRTTGVIATFSPSVRLVVLATGGFVTLSVVLNSVTGFIAYSLGSTLLTKYYYEDTDLHTSSVSPPAPRGVQEKITKMIEPWLTPLRLIPLLILAVSASLIASSYWLERLPETGDPIIAAHRGGPPPAPENTVEALESAIRAGADYSEIDVQMTRDSIPVLAHDADLMRVAGIPLEVTDTDYEEIKERVRQRDEGPPVSAWQLTTLAEALERANGRIRLMIELKYYEFDPALAEKVVGLVRDYGMEEEVRFMSLNMNGVRQLRRLAPDMRSGYISTIVIGDISRIPVDFLAINRQGVSPGLIRDARRRNVKIYAWTVNRGDHMADLIEMGVDGLITDDPELARLVLNELADMTAVERLLLRFQSLIIDRSERNLQQP